MSPSCSSRALALRTIWLQNLIASSAALQSQSSKQQAYVGAKTQQISKNIWYDMLDKFRNDRTMQQNACASVEYYKGFYSLPTRDFSQMKIPPNTKVLLYGNSFLNQILENILIANEDTLIKNGRFGGFEGRVINEHESDIAHGYLVQWDFTSGSTILEIQNYQPLQTVEKLADLEKYLQQNSFDVAFFTNPNPSCGFDFCSTCGNYWCDCMARQNDQENGWFPFECDRKFEGYLRGDRSDVNPLWDVIHKALNGKVYEMEAWSTEPRTMFHADDDHTIRTFPYLTGKACNVLDNCTNHLEIFGHQCQPGILFQLSQLFVERMYQ